MKADRRTQGKPSHLRLRTLVSIRWAAVLGQSASVVLVHYGLGYKVPVIECGVAVGVSALLNVVLTVRGQLGRNLPNVSAALYLAYDLIQLTALLYFTGGINNPFSLLILAPVIVSATVLSRVATIALGGLGVAAITLIAFHHAPLPWPSPGFELPEYYTLGVWQALVIGILFIAAWVGSVSEEARAIGDALVETQVALSRAQRLSELGALAAAAAHELGSPLATIAVVAKEMARDAPPDSPMAADLTLLIEQSDRCREILAQLSRRPDQSGGLEPGRFLPLSQFLDFVADPYRSEGKAVAVHAQAAVAAAGSDEPEIERVPEVIHALGTLIQNATQFARTTVRIDAQWTEEEIVIAINDDGPGFPPLLLDRLGEPYVSTRKDEGGHMGLGLFIAQTLLGRYGAKLAFANRREGGANVTVNWDRAMAEDFLGGLATMSDPTAPKPADAHNKSLLIVDDDRPLRLRLVQAMEKRGFRVNSAETVAEGVKLARAQPPDCAVIDLRLTDGSGLDVVAALRAARSDTRIVMLTGYGNIATAVAAVKAGAVDYLPKPADADQIEAALLNRDRPLPKPPENPMSADRVRWEHIQRVYEQCDRNVSETARRLNMHRRTLQRILSKYAPREG